MNYEEKLIARHIVDTLGLPYTVTVVDAAYEFWEDGEFLGIGMRDITGFHRAVTVAIAASPNLLHGAEIKFMRTVIGLSATQFAAQLHVDLATLSRWENDKKPISEQSERLLKLHMLLALLPQNKVRIDVVLSQARLAKYTDTTPRFEFCLADQEEGLEAYDSQAFHHAIAA